jgi:PAS domain S-box-containing protein
MRNDKHDSILGMLFETAADAEILVDLDGVLLLANAQMERLFGYDRSELLGQKIEMLVPESARSGHPGLRARFAADPTTRPLGASMQVNGRCKDGTVFPAEISLSAFTFDGQLVVSAIVRDITARLAATKTHQVLAREAERDRLQLRLDRAQRMESLGQLAGGVAHDFNNILAVIINFATFVEDEIADAERAPGGEHWSAAHGDIVEVRNAAERAARLTRQLLSFARRDVNRPQVVDLAGVLGELEPMLQRSLGERVTLVISLGAGVPMVRIDPSQLEQVLLNLVVNARDAMPEGGRVTIDTARLDADESYARGRPGIKPDMTYLCLRVTDTGTGMPPDVVDRIFEPFFSTKAESKGTGLGLATVYGVVTQAGGSIEVYSHEGRGTTFNILFPAVQSLTEAAESEGLAPPRPAAGTTILVVDDDNGIRDVAQRVLVKAGYQVLIASDGDEALAIVTRGQHQIDLLLSDMVMPGLQGQELAAAVERVRPDIKTVLMSGYAEPLVGGAELDPTLRLLDKPFTRTALLDAIHATERT